MQMADFFSRKRWAAREIRLLWVRWLENERIGRT